MWTRRQYLAWFGRVALIGMTGATLLSVCGCQAGAPQPFRVGAVVPPPQGCSTLRRSDPHGDC